MRKTTLSMVAALFFVTVFAMNAFGEGEAKKAETVKKDQPECAIYEEYWTLWVDEPAHHFEKARESFVNKDLEEAARQIRTGATFLKLEAGRAVGEGKEDLKASITELDKLANDVENGTVTSTKTLDDAFARAQYALAKHHFLKAKEALANDNNKVAGQRLKAAVTHLERSVIWSGHKEEDMMVKIVKETEVLSDKLIEGAGSARDEVGKLIESLGNAIESFGKTIESDKQ